MHRYYVFGPYMALTVVATTATYLWTSSYFINLQAQPQRRSRGIQQKEAQLMYDTVGGWSSVSYFNRQAYEKRRYATAVGQYLCLSELMSAAILIKLNSRSKHAVGAEGRLSLLLRLVCRGLSHRAWVYCRWYPGHQSNRGWFSEVWQFCLPVVCSNDRLSTCADTDLLTLIRQDVLGNLHRKTRIISTVPRSDTPFSCGRRVIA